MKKVFELTNRYIIVATPLLLFLFILCIYFLAVIQNGHPAKILFGLALMFVMTVAFSAGWGNMLKSVSNENNYDEPYTIIKDFLPGVGEFFFPVLGTFFIIFVVNIFVLLVTYYLGMHFIGDTGIASAEFVKAMANQEALKAFLTSLNTEQLMKLNMWNILILSTISVTYFLFMLYFPALFMEAKNPLKAILLSIKHTFSKKFISVLGIYLLVFCMNFLISIISSIFAGNTILSFVISLINFYFICCVSIGIFHFYNKTFINSHLGNSIDTYV